MPVNTDRVTVRGTVDAENMWRATSRASRECNNAHPDATFGEFRLTKVEGQARYTYTAEAHYNHEEE